MIEPGDLVRWTPTGDMGTVLGVTVETSAIVLFEHGRKTIGVSKLEKVERLQPDEDGNIHLQDGWRIRRTYTVGEPGEIVERLR